MAGSQGKFETRTMALVLELAMGKSRTRPDAPGRGGEEEASSINHRLICWTARLLWACIVGDTAEIARLSAILEAQYRYQLKTAFETLASGEGTEQRSPTHEKQHYQPAALLAYTAERFTLATLLDLAVRWLRASRTIDQEFLAPSPSPGGKLPAVLIPGFRWPARKPSRDFVREEWMRWFLGAPVPAVVLADPLTSVDMASLWFVDKLSPKVQAEIRRPSSVPPLRFPITLQRAGADFVGSLDWSALSALGAADIMTSAGWIGGKEVFGRDGDPVPQLLGAAVTVLGASGAPPTPAPPVMPPPDPAPADRSLASIASDLEALAAELRRRG
jgi:hypothetical protein